jgi:hypothetical protein
MDYHPYIYQLNITFSWRNANIESHLCDLSTTQCSKMLNNVDTVSEIMSQRNMNLSLAVARMFFSSHIATALMKEE